MRESAYLAILLAFTKLYVGNGQPRGSIGLTGNLGAWPAARSRDLSRQNSGLSMRPARSNSGLGMPLNRMTSGIGSTLGLGTNTGADFDSNPTKQYEEEDGQGGKTIVKEFSSPDGRSFQRQVTRMSGFFPKDAALPSRLGSTRISDPANDYRSPSSSDFAAPASPPAGGLGGSFRRNGSLGNGSFRYASPSPSGRWASPAPAADSKLQPPPIAESPAKPALQPSPSGRWGRSPFSSPAPAAESKPQPPPIAESPAKPVLQPSPSGRWGRSSLSSPAPAADSTPSNGYGDAGSSGRNDPPPSPTSGGYGRKSSFSTPNVSGGNFVVDDQLPDGRKITVRMTAPRMTDDEANSLKRHIRNTITIMFYFPTWNCALVSRLQMAPA